MTWWKAGSAMPAASALRKGRRQRDDGLAATSLTLRHPASGKTREVGAGFAWDLFLLAGLFGVPLFLRRLPQWGAAILALWVVTLFVGRLVGGAPGTVIQEALFAAFLVLQLWLGLKGNELTARSYLAHGWRLDRADQPATKRLMERWRLAR
jgi:hypothetical protein